MSLCSHCRILPAKFFCGNHLACKETYCSQNCADVHFENHVETCLAALPIGSYALLKPAEVKILDPKDISHRLCRGGITVDYINATLLKGTKILVERDDETKQLQGIVTWKPKQPYEEINMCAIPGRGRLLFNHWVENYHNPKKLVRIYASSLAIGFWLKIGFVVGLPEMQVPEFVQKAFERVNWNCMQIPPETQKYEEMLEKMPSDDRVIFDVDWTKNYYLGSSLYLRASEIASIFDIDEEFQNTIDYVRENEERLLKYNSMIMHYNPSSNKRQKI